MNCFEFRQLANICPLDMPKESMRHPDTCTNCAQFLSEQQAFERQLQHATKVPLPDKLVENIILDISLHKRRHRLWFVGVASLVVALLIGTAILVPNQNRLHAAISNHLKQDPLHQVAASTQPKQSALIKGLDLFGLRLNHHRLQIRHAGMCVIGDKLASHLVIEGEHGPVTVLIMPNHSSSQIDRTQLNGFDAVILPAKQGSIAVLGHNADEIIVIAEMLNRELTLTESTFRL